MQQVILDEFKIPNTCDECNFIRHYETGPFIRNPHCCCELIWKLKNEDYKVDKNSLDENCPFNLIKLLKTSNINKDKIIEYLLDMLEEEHMGMRAVAVKEITDKFNIEL